MFFKTHKEILELRQQVLEMTDMVSRQSDTYKERLEYAEKVGRELKEQKERADKLADEVTQKNKLLRDQTEADLLVNALKALKIIPEEDEKSGFDYFSQAANLQSQLAASQQQALRPSHGLSGLGSMLGGV